MTTRKELTAAIRERYRQAPTGDRGRILDEFVAGTGYHRKHAVRVLGDLPPRPCDLQGTGRLESCFGN